MLTLEPEQLSTPTQHLSQLNVNFMYRLSTNHHRFTSAQNLPQILGFHCEQLEVGTPFSPVVAQAILTSIEKRINDNGHYQPPVSTILKNAIAFPIDAHTRTAAMFLPYGEGLNQSDRNLITTLLGIIELLRIAVSANSTVILSNDSVNYSR